MTTTVATRRRRRGSARAALRVVDVEKRTLSRREEGMARYTRPLARVRELDRAVWVHEPQWRLQGCASTRCCHREARPRLWPCRARWGGGQRADGHGLGPLLRPEDAHAIRHGGRGGAPRALAALPSFDPALAARLLKSPAVTIHSRNYLREVAQTIDIIQSGTRVSKPCRALYLRRLTSTRARKSLGQLT
jgi:hypothetical protein